MESLIIIFVLLIALVSFQGFRYPDFQERYLLEVDRILVDKQYFRLVSSGFLHTGWLHLIFNMLALSSFGKYIILEYGTGNFALIYGLSLLGGSLMVLYFHRNHGDYRAMGASGAIFGLVYATVVTAPASEISLIFVPQGFPAWIMGTVFLALSIWGIKSQSGNIAHEAHFGGAVIGMISVIFMNPEILKENASIVALLMVPSLAFLVFVYINPAYMLVDSFSVRPFLSKRKPQRIYMSREERLNMLLDKINLHGINSLNKKEKAELEELSGKVNS